MNGLSIKCIKQGNQYVESTEKYNIVYNGFQFGNEDEFPNLKGFSIWKMGGSCILFINVGILI